jgi:hypothetical protein
MPMSFSCVAVKRPNARRCLAMATDFEMNENVAATLKGGNDVFSVMIVV